VIKDRFRHRREDVPAYLFMAYERPVSLQAKGPSKRRFMSLVARIAREKISDPIATNDIEVQICWATQSRPGIGSDLDNIIKPIIDALKGIAYHDDKQVRSVVAALFDLQHKTPIALAGYVEDIQPLLYSGREDAVLIAIYSDARLAELGGAQQVEKQRSEEFRLFLQSQRAASVRLRKT
jgi:Holliday junction resolvase RusA-like endonuclease